MLYKKDNNMAAKSKPAPRAPAGLRHPKAGLVSLVDALKAIDTASKLNATTITDNNGRRIEL